MKRVALFFGSFNPLHNGHLAISNYILEKDITDEVWFIVSPKNPLKSSSVLLDESSRLLMAKKVINNVKKMKVSDVEFFLDKPSYTYKTLDYLSENFKEIEFYLIMGEDNLEILPKWKSYDSIIRNYKIIVYPRPDCSTDYCKYKNIIKLNAELNDISSTQIRKLAKDGSDFSHLVPLEIVDDIMRYYCSFGE